MKKLIAGIFILTAPFPVTAQVNIDKSLEFSPASSRVQQLAFPKDSSSAAHAESVASGMLHYAEAQNAGNVFNLTLNPPPPSYAEGMSITFIAPATIDDSLLVTVNNLPAVVVHKDYRYITDSADILQGQAVQIVYSGGNFNIISHIQKNCPAGFVHVNEKYCIQEAEAGTGISYFDAVKNCLNAGARLCSWGEWYYACQKAGLNLTSMTNNYEWTDDAGNEDGAFRITGAGSCTQVAVGGGTTTVYSYRCCYSK